MSSIVHYPHLTSDEPDAVRIGRTRYKGIHLASEHYHYGWSAEEIMWQYPDLRPEEGYAALTYFYDHDDELVQLMALHAAKVTTLRKRQTLSRAELLARQNRT